MKPERPWNLDLSDLSTAPTRTDRVLRWLILPAVVGLGVAVWRLL